MSGATIPFFNASGLTIPSFAVLLPAEVGIVEGQAVLTVDQPNEGFARFYYVNGPVRVLPDEFGVCHDGRWGPVLCSTESATLAGESWGPKAGQWRLFPDRPGFTILGGRQPPHDWLWARQHEVHTLLATLDETLTPDSLVTVNILSGTSGALFDTGLDLTARDRVLRNSSYLPTGTEVTVDWIVTDWYITGAKVLQA